jgi:hypothetical protein
MRLFDVDSMKNTSLLLFFCALVSSAQADIVSTTDREGDFLTASHWGGVDPVSKPDETFIISSGHKLLMKGSRNAVWPVKTVVLRKGALLTLPSKTVFDCSGKTLVLDGGELNMDQGQLTNLILDFRSDSTVCIGTANFEGGQVIGKGVMEFVRDGGNRRGVTLNNVDFTRYEGKILISENLKSESTLTLSGSSRNLNSVSIEITPHNRATFTLKMAEGINMSAPLLSPGRWGKLHLGNTSCTFGSGTHFGFVAKGKTPPLAPGVYTPASTANYSQVPTIKGTFANLQNKLEPSSIEGSSIIILPPADQKSTHRVDTGSTFVLKEGTLDCSAKGFELCLNGGTVQSSGSKTITGFIQILNHSVLEFDVPKSVSQDALRFSKGALKGTGNIRLGGKGGRLAFVQDFNMQDYSGKLMTEDLKADTELVFANGGWGNGTLVLNSKVPVVVTTMGAPLQTMGTFILDNEKAKIDLNNGLVTIGFGSRVGIKTLCEGMYTEANSSGFKSVPATWMESKGKESVLRSGTVDLSPYLLNSGSATLQVMDFKRVRSTTKTGSISSPASWGGFNPNQLTAAQYEIAPGHVMHSSIEKWQACELAIGKGGILSVDSGNVDLGGRNLIFHEGALRQETTESRTINGNMVIADDHYLKDEYSGTLILDGGDLTVTGVIMGSRNKQSTLFICRSKPGSSKITIDGDMGQVDPTGVGFDIVVNRFTGHLDMVWSKGLLNEGHIEFNPKSGIISSLKGFNAPRGTLRLPANSQIKLDLKNAINTFQIGTTIGGIYVERGNWTEEKTVGFTKVPECNTSRRVDLTPYLLNTKGASLRISNPVAGVDKEEAFDTDQIYVPETAFNPDTLKQLREQSEVWVAPFRTALRKKSNYHKVEGKEFTHSDYTYGTFPHRVFNLYTAYKILGDDPEVFGKMMIMADYFQQLVTQDPLATSSKDQRVAGEPCPAESATCSSFMSMTLCAMEIWKKEYEHPGSVDKKVLARADEYLTFAWNQNEPRNPKVGLKKFLCPDGHVDPVTGVPLSAINRGKFTWNSESGVWQAEAPFLEALRLRKLATGKTDWDKVYDASAKGLAWYMDYFFRDNSCGEINGKKYVWWTYNTTTPGQAGFQGEGLGWKEGLYKGMKIIKSGEDYGHIGADLLGFSWIWTMRRNAYGLTDERMERVINGCYYWIGNSPFGGLGNMFNPYRIELGEPIPKGEIPTTNPNYAKLTLFKIPRSYRNIVLNRPGMKEFNVDWLWVKWLYQNRDTVGVVRLPPGVQ